MANKYQAKYNSRKRQYNLKNVNGQNYLMSKDAFDHMYTLYENMYGLGSSDPNSEDYTDYIDTSMLISPNLFNPFEFSKEQMANKQTNEHEKWFNDNVTYGSDSNFSIVPNSKVNLPPTPPPVLPTNANQVTDLQALSYIENETGESVVKGDSFVNKYENSFIGKNSQAISAGLDTLGNITSAFNPIKDGPNATLRQGIDLGWNSVADTAALFGPYGQMVSMGMKAANALNNIQGAIFGATDNMTKTDAIFDSPLGFLTGVGWINQAFGQKSNTITKDEETFELVGGSYAGTNNVVDDALTKSGKKYGAFSGAARNQANKEIAEATRQQNVTAGIADNATMRNNIKGAMTAINGNARSFALNGGYNQAAIHVGRQGMILQRVKNIDFNKKPIIEIIDKPIEEEEEFYVVLDETPIVEFEKGGSFNIIPEGALHARKHNINMKGITKKGIPVVSEEEGGQIQLQAEIEHSEIIFRLEVTKTLEELMNKYNSDDSSKKEKDLFAIEAGKLLVKEILNNTQDNVGLIDNTSE